MLLIMILTVIHMQYPHACYVDVADDASAAEQECSPGIIPLNLLHMYVYSVLCRV